MFWFTLACSLTRESRNRFVSYQYHYTSLYEEHGSNPHSDSIPGPVRRQVKRKEMKQSSGNPCWNLRSPTSGIHKIWLDVGNQNKYVAGEGVCWIWFYRIHLKSLQIVKKLSLRKCRRFIKPFALATRRSRFSFLPLNLEQSLYRVHKIKAQESSQIERHTVWFLVNIRTHHKAE